MICCCSLAGTQACKNCLQYIEHFGKQEIGKNYIIITQTGTPYVFESGVYCPECGEMLGLEANYCPNCGAKIKE